MNQALAKTLAGLESIEITPDTIQSYRSHLQIAELKDSSFLYYALEDVPSSALCSRKMSHPYADKIYEYQCYASCSVATILGLSNQRPALFLLLLPLLWSIIATDRLRKKGELQPAIIEHEGLLCAGKCEGNKPALGSLVLVGDRFYNQNTQQPIHFTPMQEQLMRMFLTTESHRLTKQQICNELWPRKPDASDTLYTLIKRLRPIVEQQGGLQITSDRGKDYSLEICARVSSDDSSPI